MGQSILSGGGGAKIATRIDRCSALVGQRAQSAIFARRHFKRRHLRAPGLSLRIRPRIAKNLSSEGFDSRSYVRVNRRAPGEHGKILRNALLRNSLVLADEFSVRENDHPAPRAPGVWRRAASFPARTAAGYGDR